MGEENDDRMSVIVGGGGDIDLGRDVMTSPPTISGNRKRDTRTEVDQMP